MTLSSVVLTFVYAHVDSPDTMQGIDALGADLNSKPGHGNRTLPWGPNTRPGGAGEGEEADAVIVADQGVGRGVTEQDRAKLAGPGAGTEPSERLGVDPAFSNTLGVGRDRLGEYLGEIDGFAPFA
jgi:hypothetical protein